MIRLSGSILVALLLACAPSSRAQSGAVNSAADGDLPPPGYGTLSQNDVSFRLVVDDVEMRFLPLDERLLRLLARDAYASFHQLVSSNQMKIDSLSAASGVGSPGLVLITFFGLRRDARFDPQDVAVLIRNRLFRPLGIVPLTASFSSRQLDARAQASAIYLFEERIPVFEPFTVSYGAATSEAWQNLLQRLQREQARVAGRARRDPKDSVGGP